MKFGSLPMMGNIAILMTLVILLRTGRPYRIPGTRSCRPHPHPMNKEDWDNLRAAANNSATAQAEGYATARHDQSTGRVVASVYPAIRNPAFIRRIKSKGARHFFVRAFMAQEIGRRASPAWAEALVTPNVNKPVLTADVDNPYRERYRNEHFENTVLRTLLGLPLKNAGDDLNYRPADSYAIQLQRCPWGLQVPPGWTPENDDFDKDDKERDSAPPPLEDWNVEAGPPRPPRDQPTPRGRDSARGEDRESEESSRQRDHQPRETRREREGRRDTSSRDQSRRGDQPRARGRERGQGDHGSRERQERGGRHASRGRDDRSQRERSRGRHASKGRDNRSQRERSRGRHASKGRDSRAQREKSRGRESHSRRDRSRGEERSSHQETRGEHSRDRGERGESQDELDRIRKEYTRNKGRRGDKREDHPWSKEISPSKKLDRLAAQKKDLTRKRDRSRDSSRSLSRDRSCRGGSQGRDSRGASTETTDLATPSPEATRPKRYSGARKKSSTRTKFGHRDSDTGSDTSEDSESSVCSWDTPSDRRALPPPPPGHCAPASSPLKRRKSIDSWATQRPLDCDRPDDTHALLAIGVPVFSLTESDREFIDDERPVPREYIERRDFESQLLTFSPEIWIGLTQETLLQQQGPPDRVQLCEDRIMASLLPRREWSRDEAQDAASTLKTLPLMLALSHRWQIRIPNPPDLPFLEAIVWEDPECPREDFRYRDFRSSLVAAERWVGVIRRILYWLGEVPSGRRLAEQLTEVLNLSQKRFGHPVTEWDTLAAQQPTIAPELRRDWHQKQRQEGNEGLLPAHRAEGRDVRRVTLKQTEQTAETAEVPPRDDTPPRAQPVATEPKEAALLTIGVDPEEARELLGSPVGSPSDLMEVDDTALDE